MEIRHFLRSVHEKERNKLTVENLLKYNYRKSKSRLLKGTQKPGHQSQSQVSNISDLCIKKPDYFTAHAVNRIIPHKIEQMENSMPDRPYPKFEYLRKGNGEENIYKTALLKRMLRSRKVYELPFCSGNQFKQIHDYLKRKDRFSHPLCALFRIKCDRCKCPLDCYNKKFQHIMASKGREILTGFRRSQEHKQLDQKVRIKVAQIVSEAVKAKDANNVLNQKTIEIKQKQIRDEISVELSQEINDQTIEEYQQWANSLFRVLSNSIHSIQHQDSPQLAVRLTHISHQKMSSTNHFPTSEAISHDSVNEKTGIIGWATSQNSIPRTAVSRKKPNQSLHLPLNAKQNNKPSENKITRSRNITPDHRIKRADNKVKKIQFHKKVSNVKMNHALRKKARIRDKQCEQIKLVSAQQKYSMHSQGQHVKARYEIQDGVSSDIIEEHEQLCVRKTVRKSSRLVAKKRNSNCSSSSFSNPLLLKKKEDVEDKDQQFFDPEDLTFEQIQQPQLIQQPQCHQVRIRQARRWAIISKLNPYSQSMQKHKQMLESLLQTDNNHTRQLEPNASSETQQMQEAWMLMITGKPSVSQIAKMNESELDELKKMYQFTQNNIVVISKVNAILKQHGLQKLIPSISDSGLTIVRKLKQIEKIIAGYQHQQRSEGNEGSGENDGNKGNDGNQSNEGNKCNKGNDDSTVEMMKKYVHLIEDNLRIRMSIKAKSKTIEIEKQPTESTEPAKMPKSDDETLNNIHGKYASLQGVKFFNLFICDSDGWVDGSATALESREWPTRKLKLAACNIVQDCLSIHENFFSKIETFTSQKEKTPYDFFHYKFMVEMMIASRLSGMGKQQCDCPCQKQKSEKISYLKTFDQIYPSNTHSAIMGNYRSSNIRQLYGLKCEQVLEQKQMEAHCRFEQ